MERIELAPGYSISRVINGAWQLSAGHHNTGGIDRKEAVTGLLRRAQAGLTTFDCADIYTGVEELLGEVLRVRSRPEIQVHTKLVPDLDALSSLTRERVEAVVDRSLVRLGAERLDLVQLHWWDFRVPGFVEAAGWLDALRRAGKVRHVGVTNFDAARLSEVLDAGVEVVSDQVQYSVIDRRPERALEGLVLERAREPDRGLGMLCYGTLAGGFLSERWLGAPEPVVPAEALPNRSLTKYKLILEEFGPWDLFQELLATLRRIGERHGEELSTVAVRWVLDRPGVAAAVVGATGDRHLESTLRVFRLRLDAADRAAIEGVLERAPDPTGPEGPVYGLERRPGGRHAAIMRYDLNRMA